MGGVPEAADSPAAPRFLVDASLIKLGKYLRCAGFDAAWDERASARVLAARAEREDRVFVTRSTRMGFEFAPSRSCVTVVSMDAREQFHEVVRALGLHARGSAFTRCIRCNVELAPVPDSESIRTRVPPAVFEAQRKFFTCPSCGTVFWHGSHVANTCRALGLERP